MEPYVAFFTRFLHAVSQAFRESEAFLFHTRLAHVSSALKERHPARALDRLALMAAGVGGGTKIGECLTAFNRRHAKRVIHSRTCVMILSDGYDTGPPEVLASAMRDLRRRCKRIVWLNPLTGRRGFEPIARGMQAALPYLDLLGAGAQSRKPGGARTLSREDLTDGRARAGGSASGQRPSLRARHRRPHRLRHRREGGRQGPDRARRLDRGGLDRRRLRPRGGGQGGAPMHGRRPVAAGLDRAERRARRTRRGGGRGARRRLLRQEFLPEPGHDGHFRRAGPAEPAPPDPRRFAGRGRAREARPVDGLRRRRRRGAGGARAVRPGCAAPRRRGGAA